jgi:uncharacterized protein YutE (UPF0331/DUF86 family)
MKRENEKIDEIRKFLEELEKIVPEKFEEYNSNNLTKAACERYVEKVVEGVTDIAFMIIKHKKFEIPEDDIDSFRILKDHKVIKEELYKKLKQAKGMRNILAHEYGKIDDSIIFNSIKNELGEDVENFLKEATKWLK